MKALTCNNAGRGPSFVRAFQTSVPRPRHRHVFHVLAKRLEDHNEPTVGSDGMLTPSN